MATTIDEPGRTTGRRLAAASAGGGRSERDAAAERVAAGPKSSNDGVERKLAALEEALQHNGPTGDIDEIERTIEAGYDE